MDSLLDQKPDGEAYWDRLYSLEVKAHHVADANGLIIFRPWVRASAFARGYDKIDLEACTANDVAVFNAPDTLTHSTASAALLFMLALAKRLPVAGASRAQRMLEWAIRLDGFRSHGPDAEHYRLGQDWTGTSAPGGAFRDENSGVFARCRSGQAAALGVTLASSLEEVIEEADFVSLYCRLEPHNHRMLGQREFRPMKRSGYFVNVGRDELVGQPSPVQALRDGWIAGAGLDVFEVEPLPANDPLLALNNVILTPPLAALDKSGRSDDG
jgi:phosphoglycerate dehydrogenase-like enzyme